jgi:hypothetical protein
VKRLNLVRCVARKGTVCKKGRNPGKDALLGIMTIRALSAPEEETSGSHDDNLLVSCSLSVVVVVLARQTENKARAENIQEQKKQNAVVE